MWVGQHTTHAKRCRDGRSSGAGATPTSTSPTPSTAAAPTAASTAATRAPTPSTSPTAATTSIAAPTTTPVATSTTAAATSTTLATLALAAAALRSCRSCPNILSNRDVSSSSRGIRGGKGGGGAPLKEGRARSTTSSTYSKCTSLSFNEMLLEEVNSEGGGVKREGVIPDRAKRVREASDYEGDLLRSGVAIFDLDFDTILAAMYAVSISVEGDCYVCVPPDLGIEGAALGASESAAPGAGESALSGTASAQVLHTFTLDSGASRSFFRDRTTLTPLHRPVALSLADPSRGPVLAHYSIVLP
ncbi:unnamed protein product, partial [Closterium sp. NIES-54]